MSDPDHTTADQLDSLLREGKISESDYEQLHEALDSGRDLGGGNLPGLPASHGPGSRDIPPVLWVGLVGLGLIAVSQFVYAVSVSSPGLVIAAIVAVGIVVGLYLGHKWAYVAILVFCALGILVTFANKGFAVGLGVLVVDSVVFVPVLMASRYFFPEAITGIRR